MAKKTKQPKKPAPLVADCPRCKNQLGRLIQQLADVTSERDGLRHQLDLAHYGGYTPMVVPDYEDHLEVLMRVDVGSLDAAIDRSLEAHVKAHAYDSTGGASNSYCDRCESNICICGLGATPYPSVSDRTGETAVRLASKPDRAEADRHDLSRAKRLVKQAADILERLHRAYSLHMPAAHQRTAVENTPGCKSCARLKIELSDGTEHPRWEPIHRDGLCSWCYEWRRKTAKGWPTLDVLRAHHDGKRIVITATKAS